MLRDDILEENEMLSFVQELIDKNYLGGAALGVAKQAAGKGLDTLSSKQKYVFDKYVLEPYVKKECSLCSSDIPWSEMSNALDNGSMCGYCEYKMDKMNRDD